MNTSRFSADGALDGMTIRSLRSDDREQIKTFFAMMGEAAASFFNVNRGNEKRVMEFFENGKPDHSFYVLEERGEVIALAFLWDLFSLIPKFGIAVRDDRQGRGVGTFFLTGLLDRFRAEGYAGVLLTTAKTNYGAQRLYEKCGFERLGTAENGEYCYVRRFEKP